MELESVNNTIESTSGVDFGNVSTARDGVTSVVDQTNTLALSRTSAPTLQETQETINQLNNAAPRAQQGFNGNNYEG